MKKEHVIEVINNMAKGDREKRNLLEMIYDIAKDKVDRYPDKADGLLVFKMRQAVTMLNTKKHPVN